MKPVVIACNSNTWWFIKSYIDLLVWQNPHREVRGFFYFFFFESPYEACFCAAVRILLKRETLIDGLLSFFVDFCFGTGDRPRNELCFSAVHSGLYEQPLESVWSYIHLSLYCILSSIPPNHCLWFPIRIKKKLQKWNFLLKEKRKNQNHFF